MAVLVEGQTLPLSSKTEPGKSVVYVKLTDSALRSLEEYLRLKVSFFYSISIICLPCFQMVGHFGRQLRFVCAVVAIQFFLCPVNRHLFAVFVILLRQ